MSQTTPVPDSFDLWTLVGKTVFVLLAIFGALSGFILFYNWIRATARTARQWLGLWRKAENDYYFRRLDVACRVISPTHYQCYRGGEIVALKHGLRGFPVGTGPNQTLDIVIESLDGHTLAEMPTNELGPWRPLVSTFVDFGKALKKREHAFFGLMINGKAKNDAPIDRHWQWTSEHRVDELILRVSFAANPPERVTFKELNNEGKVVQEETVPIDPTSHEARKTIRWPKPARNFVLRW